MPNVEVVEAEMSIGIRMSVVAEITPTGSLSRAAVVGTDAMG